MSDTAKFSDVQKTVYEFLSNNTYITQNFSSIYMSPKFEVENNSLMIDPIGIEEKEFYGFFILRYTFTIVASSRSKAFELLDILLKHIDRSYYINQNRTISIYLHYTGNYDEIFDTEQNRIIVSTVWILKAVFL